MPLVEEEQSSFEPTFADSVAAAPAVGVAVLAVGVAVLAVVAKVVASPETADLPPSLVLKMWWEVVVSGARAPGAGRATPVVEQLVALAWPLAEAPAGGHTTPVMGS